MVSDTLIRQLKSENDQLQIELKDVNEMIKVREEELELLRKTAAYAVELQSRLDVNMDEIYQMQDRIGEEQRKAAGAAKREASLESELLASIEMETELYNMKDSFASTKAALADINNEVSKMSSLYQQISALTKKVTELESNLEIAALENGFLKEEVEKYRQEEALKKSGE